MRIRRPALDELPVLQEIERAAGEQFREVGMAEIADDDPFTLDELASYRRSGGAWVAADAADHPVAYLLVDTVDGSLHIEQVSVDPAHARRGIGRLLLEHAATVAVDEHLSALTLTTFVDVPWNAPYYERCGFRRVPEAEVTPGLRQIRQREADHGLDRWPRTCMRHDL